MVLLHLWVGLNLYIIPKRASRDLEGPKTTASLQRWTPWTWANKLASTYLPQGQAPRYPRAWLKISDSLEYPTVIGWTIGGRVHLKLSARKVTHPSTIVICHEIRMVHQKSSARKVTHPSTIPIYMGSGLRLGFKRPAVQWSKILHIQLALENVTLIQDILF